MRGTREKTLTLQRPPSEGKCKHHWLIDTPSGPVSRGTCRLCGEEREFKNYLDLPYWDDDLSLDQASTGARFHNAAAPADAGEVNEE